MLSPPAVAPSGLDLETYDLDIHGLVRVRLRDATRADAAAVGAQLGVPPTEPVGPADVVVRFVDRMPLSGPLRLLGAGEAGYSDDAFIALRGRRKASVRVSLPLAALGERPELVCERDVEEIPFLVPIVNLTMLAHDVLPLHAAAFDYGGVGIVVTGWSKGGKTEALLGFASAGARYVGDEWVYVKPDGTVVGLREPIRVWDWHLADLPDVARRLRPHRLRLAVTRAAVRALEAGERPRIAPSATVRRLRHVVHDQRHVDAPPEILFGPEAIAATCRLDRLFFVVSHAAPTVTVARVDPLEVARRIAHSLAYERRALLTAYEQYRFAFPDARSRLLDAAADHERRLLKRAFAGRPAHLVTHPYPVPIARVFAAMEPHCR